MSSLISVTVTNLVRLHLKQLALESAPFLVKFYRRYVDDIFVILGSQNVNSFYETLNNIPYIIQFTREIEINHTLSFLNIAVIHRFSGRLDTTLFRKECDTGSFLNFNSHHPTEHKRSVLRTLIERTDTLPSPNELRPI